MADASPASLPTVGSVLLSMIKGFGTFCYWVIIVLGCLILAILTLVVVCAVIAYYYTTLYIIIRWTAGRRTLFAKTGPSLWDIGAIFASISTICAFILDLAVVDQSSQRDTTFLQGAWIMFKCLPASTLIAVAFQSALLGIIWVVVAIKSAVSAIRMRRAKHVSGNAIVGFKLLDKDDENNDLGDRELENKDVGDEGITRSFPSTFAGFCAYFVAEMKETSRIFEKPATECQSPTTLPP